MQLYVCALVLHISLMKDTIIILLLLLATGSAHAQNAILRNSPFKNTFNSSAVEQSIRELSDVWKADGNGVTFVITVDSLPLSSSEILAYAREYLEEAYQFSKYEIENLNTEKAFVIGKGEFNNFETYAAFPNQYTFNCEHHLRIDAKEGRARICFMVTEYDLLRTNGNKDERNKIKVKDVSPANPNAETSHKMYNKAFLSMAKLAITTLYDIREMLKSKVTSEVEDW